MWAALMMIKESGLPTADIWRLKIGDFERNKDDEEQVYVLYRRDDLKTATRDDTFALSPCGGLYCNRYIAYLAASGEERLQTGKYLLSSDPEGNCALVPSEVNKYVRTQLNAAQYGYQNLRQLCSQPGERVAARDQGETSRVQRGENDELRFRGTDAKGEMRVIVQCKNIKEGDVIEVISEGGCYLEIVE